MKETVSKPIEASPGFCPLAGSGRAVVALSARMSSRVALANRNSARLMPRSVRPRQKRSPTTRTKTKAARSRCCVEKRKTAVVAERAKPSWSRKAKVSRAGPECQFGSHLLAFGAGAKGPRIDVGAGRHDRIAPGDSAHAIRHFQESRAFGSNNNSGPMVFKRTVVDMQLHEKTPAVAASRRPP